MNSAEQFRKMREEFRKDNISDHDLDMIFGESAAEILGLSKERREVLRC